MRKKYIPDIGRSEESTLSRSHCNMFLAFWLPALAYFGSFLCWQSKSYCWAELHFNGQTQAFPLMASWALCMNGLKYMSIPKCSPLFVFFVSAKS